MKSTTTTMRWIWKRWDDDDEMTTINECNNDNDETTTMRWRWQRSMNRTTTGTMNMTTMRWRRSMTMTTINEYNNDGDDEYDNDEMTTINDNSITPSIINYSITIVLHRRTSHLESVLLLVVVAIYRRCHFLHVHQIWIARLLYSYRYIVAYGWDAWQKRSATMEFME